MSETPQKTFKVMSDYRHPDAEHVNRVPWSFVESHEAQAWKNHGQTLTRLNERGGLSVVELWHVVNDKDWYGPLPHGARVTYNQAVEWLASNSVLEGTESANAMRASPPNLPLQ